MRVIGTAGHVDHGKSTLVRALTGMDPDRLKEEQEREMTIDLGFAWLALPDGEVVSIVDVPGHEDFIRNMLAGVGGIDLALLVIAADESVMPQTREHLHILDLLGVAGGLVVLTKSDLAESAEWLELVELEVAETLAGTVLDGAPLLRVAARQGEGLAELRAALAEALAARPTREDRGKPRLSVDRAFSVAGFGTVVTGTLLDGTLVLGDEVVLLPSGQRGRVRGLQTHNERVERATPGRRLAVNVSGVELGEVQRGDLLARPGEYAASRLVDVTLRLLPDGDQPLQHDQEVEFFSGAAQRVARVRLIGTREMAPGAEGFAQLRLAEPLALARGDRFILRRPSPSQTLGGGTVLDAAPRGRWRRFRPETMERFRLLADGSPVELLAQALAAREPTDERSLLAALPLPDEVARAALAEALAERRVRRLNEGTLLTAGGWARRQEGLLADLRAYHAAHPLRLGLPREEVASRVGLKPKAAAALLEELAAQALLRADEQVVALPAWEVTLNEAQQQQAETLLRRFAEAPYTPPNPGEAEALVGDELLALLVARGALVRLSPEVLLSSAAYATMVQGVRDIAAHDGEISAAALRDRFDTSRKYAIALLEHLDALKVTRRVGDKRLLRG